MMVKITSKLYRTSDLLEVINVMETVLSKINNEMNSEASNIVIDLRKAGYKIVKVDDGESNSFSKAKNVSKRK